MTDNDLKEIQRMLETTAANKKAVALAKAQKEVETINRQYDAYWDGVYDAIKAVSKLIPGQPSKK